eukprot:scaffold80899_cov55-Phaeocystis_antarctica.AAC.1
MKVGKIFCGKGKSKSQKVREDARHRGEVELVVRDAQRVQLLGDSITKGARTLVRRDGVPFSSVLRVALGQAHAVVARVPQRARRAHAPRLVVQLGDAYKLRSVDAREAHVLRGRDAGGAVVQVVQLAPARARHRTRLHVPRVVAAVVVVRIVSEVSDTVGGPIAVQKVVDPLDKVGRNIPRTREGVLRIEKVHVQSRRDALRSWRRLNGQVAGATLVRRVLRICVAVVDELHLLPWSQSRRGCLRDPVTPHIKSALEVQGEDLLTRIAEEDNVEALRDPNCFVALFLRTASGRRECEAV